MKQDNFQILSLDGGGIRGAYSAAFLAETERLLGHPIMRHFDLVAGTSTGGIIATALAFGHPAEEIEELYREHGREIFAREHTVKVPLLAKLLAWTLRRKVPDLASDPESLFEAKYSPAPLTKRLEALLGDRTLNEASVRLLLPSIDLTQGKTVVFKTPHLPGLVRDRKMRAVDVVLATSAAPTYFPPHVPHDGVAYCDGGLWANNPALVAYAEAVRISNLCTRTDIDPDFSPDDVLILSVGTGTHSYSIAPPGKLTGLTFWGPELLNVIGASQSQGTDFQAQYLLDKRYMRVDFPVPDVSWKLDCVDIVEKLLHLGREAASAQWENVQKHFDHVASPMSPFPVAKAQSS